MPEPTGRYRTRAHCPDCQTETWHKINRDGVWVCNECEVVNEP